MAPSAIIIDPEGDLWISTQHLARSDGKPATGDVGATDGKDANEDKVNIKVSSKVLTLASPVFKMILTGWGKEAAEFSAKKASSEAYTLDLPEDDAKTAALLFEILHLKQTARSDQPSPSRLEKLAFLADKYECFGALRFCGAIWIRDWLPENTESFKMFLNDPSCPRGDDVQYIDNLKKLLVFSYVADLPKEFNTLAWHLFLFTVGTLSAKGEGNVNSLVHHELLRHDVTGHLDLRRAELANIYHAGLMAPISHDWETSGAYCSGATKVIAAYFKFLSESHVLPYDLEFSGHSFYELFSLEYPVFKMEKCGKYCRGCVQDHTNPMASDLAVELKTAIYKIQQQEGYFVCLDCIKSDGKTDEERTCRMDH